MEQETTKSTPAPGTRLCAVCRAAWATSFHFKWLTERPNGDLQEEELPLCERCERIGSGAPMTGFRSLDELDLEHLKERMRRQLRLLMAGRKASACLVDENGHRTQLKPMGDSVKWKHILEMLEVTS